MSGIAEILINLGFKVSGSDRSLNQNCKRLSGLGAKIFAGHAAANLAQDVSLLVYSSAVKQDNPEVVEAQARGLPVIRRAEVLAELLRLKFGIAVAGSHGKTTTTSLIASVLEVAGLDPTVVIGGQVRSIGTGAKLGKGDFLVAESDESDRSFLLLKPSIAIVTNIDAEHMGAYGSMQDLENCFETFVQAVPFYGLAVLCVDDARVRSLAEKTKVRKCTYGLSPDAQIRATEITPQQGVTRYRLWRAEEDLGEINLALPGRHFVCNSLAAVAVGLELGISVEVIRSALENFGGVGRRLELVGVSKGVTFINDYGHHPSEIRATIEAVKSGWRKELNKLHVIFQPHRYTRTRDAFVEFLSCFSEADDLILTEIYAASEEPLEGITGRVLFESVTHPSKQFVPNLEDIAGEIIPELRSGDVVLCLGAGSIGSLPELLLQGMK